MNKAFLNFHSWLLIIAGLLGSFVSLLGYFLETGPFSFLFNQNIAVVGLFEAYLLATVCGVMLRVGFHFSNSGYWHIMAALVHIPLITTNLLFWSFYSSYNILTAGIAATVLHALLIIAELIVFYTKNKYHTL